MWHGVRRKAMFKVGEKYKIYRSGAIELKDKKWVKAVVEHIPEHERFVRFRLHFTTCFGEHTSYIESFTMNELVKMMKNGEMVRA